MCESVHVSTDSHGSQKQVLDPLELELQVVVSHCTWVLGIEPGSAGKKNKHSSAEPALYPTYLLGIL